MAHKGLANTHGMHRMLLEDGSLQRRTKNVQGNDLNTPTSSCLKPWSQCDHFGRVSTSGTSQSVARNLHSCIRSLVVEISSIAHPM